MLKKIPFVFLLAAIVTATFSGCSSDPNECEKDETKCEDSLAYNCIWDEDEEIWKWDWHDCLLGCTDSKTCREDNCVQGAYQCAADGVTLQRCNAFLFEEKFPDAVDSEYWKSSIGEPTAGVGHWVDLEKCHSGCNNDRCNPDVYDNDANNNHMIDQYETAADQGKDCMFYSDCTDFCDSLIGHKCSTKCTSDDQCVSDKYICRPDGRCAIKYFESVWEIPYGSYYGGHQLTILFNEETVDSSTPCDITIDWGDGTAPTHYDNYAEPFRHKYQETNTYHIRINGIFQGFTLRGNKYDSLMRIESFGLVKLAHDAFDSYTYHNENHYDINLSDDAFPSNDIPDATLLTNMSYMFAYYCNGERSPDISQWDTHYVTDMSGTFAGACKLTTNRDITQWDTSNVENMDSMFSYNYDFNSDLSKWDTSKVTNMDSIFFQACEHLHFDLSKWNFSNVKYCRGFVGVCTIPEENSKITEELCEQCGRNFD